MVYDTHAHLNFPQLFVQIEEIVKKSKEAGVTGIIVASADLEGSKIAIGLAQKYPGYLFASVGIHPQKTDSENKMTIEEQLTELGHLLSTDHRPSPVGSIVAIGETGLDFSEPPPGEEKRSQEDQDALFEGQIKLAQEHSLPLIIHARQAVDEVIERLSLPEHRQIRGVFHCYAGGKKRIEKILGLPGEWYFGFDGNLTYDEGLQSLIPLIPPERLLIETDSPFLTPVPHRGEINRPAFLPLIQQKINEILGKDLTAQIVQNSQKLFSLSYS